MGRNEARAGHVRKLKDFAKAAGVKVVWKDDASRDLVSDMVSRTRAAKPSQETLTKLEQEFKLSEATFQALLLLLQLLLRHLRTLSLQCLSLQRPTAFAVAVSC